jgi:hypothetical protein
LNRIRGERADNLERAIALYEGALTIHTRDAFPTDWARTQNNLAVTYGYRIRGERADNLERAIALYEAKVCASGEGGIGRGYGPASGSMAELRHPKRRARRTSAWRSSITVNSRAGNSTRALHASQSDDSSI